MTPVARAVALAMSLLFGSVGGASPATGGADAVLLTVEGPSLGVHTFSRAQLEALPQHELQTATMYTDARPVFRGPFLTDVLAAAGQNGEADLAMTAEDTYRVTIPSADVRHYGLILAMAMDGVRLTLRHRGPIWLMYPVDTLAKADRAIDKKLIWQLVRIEVQ